MMNVVNSTLTTYRPDGEQSSTPFPIYEDEHPLHSLTPAEFVLWIFLYGLVAFLAVSGNLLVIYVIYTSPRLQNVTSYFIVNLAVADCLTGLLAIPFKFQAALLQYWPLPSFMCSLVPFVETLTLSVSVFTLTASTLDRFQTVVIQSNNKMTKNAAKLIIFSIWGISIACSIPYGWDHRLHQTVSGDNASNLTLICYPMHVDDTWWIVYNVYLTIIQYFVPLVIITVVYCIIGFKVWLTKPMIDNSDERGQMFEKNKKRVLKMLVIVVVVFTFCWLPYETYLVLNELRPNINEYFYINVIFFCCHWLAMSNSCLNPIIYGVYNEKFQKEYKRVLCGMCYGSIEPSSSNRELRLNSTIDHRPTAMTRCVTLDGVNSCHYYIVSELGKDDD